MKFIHWMARKIGLIEPTMPAETPHIAVYSLLILDGLFKKSTSFQSVKQAIKTYPEDTHNEGHICKNMMQFVEVFSTFELLTEVYTRDHSTCRFQSLAQASEQGVM